MRRTEWTSLRKCGFSEKERGVTGTAVVVPRARCGWGGEVGVRVRVQVSWGEDCEVVGWT